MVTVFSDPNVIKLRYLTYEVIINFYHIDRKYRWKITKYRIDRKIAISPTNNAKINVSIHSHSLVYMIMNS